MGQRWPLLELSEAHARGSPDSDWAVEQQHPVIHAQSPCGPLNCPGVWSHNRARAAGAGGSDWR